jgi:hypothetical protein
MGGSCYTSGEERNAYSVLVGNQEGRRSVGGPRHMCEDNIKMDELHPREL